MFFTCSRFRIRKIVLRGKDLNRFIPLPFACCKTPLNVIPPKMCHKIFRFDPKRLILSFHSKSYMTTTLTLHRDINRFEGGNSKFIFATKFALNWILKTLNMLQINSVRVITHNHKKNHIKVKSAVGGPFVYIGS